MRRALLLAAGLLGLTLPVHAAAQDHAVAAGITMSGGIIGAEWVHHARGAPFGYAVGAGYRGIGARGQLRFDERDFGDGGPQWKYVSVGAAAAPWLIGDAEEAPLYVFVEGGIQGALAHRVYVDFGLGAFVPVGGTYRGYALGPALHVTIGVAY